MRSLTLVPALLALTTSLAAGQQDPRSAGFIDFRYASHTSLTLYGGYDIGGTMMVIGMVQNPRTEYRETVAGAAWPVHVGHASATVALAGAYASDGWYGQVYLLPAYTLGPIALSGLLEAYAPLEDEGARQFYLNPIKALVPVAHRLHVGASYTLATQAGSPTRQSVGPTLQIGMPGWTATLTALAGVGETTSEVRVGIRAAL